MKKRSFQNFKYNKIEEAHFKGERTMMFNDYKFVLDGQSPNKNGVELYNLANDLGEQNNIADEDPEIVLAMQKQMFDWQQSVLNGLSWAGF